MGLRDYTAIARLGLALRRIWHNKPTITVAKLKESVGLVFKFITGRELPK